MIDFIKQHWILLVFLLGIVFFCSSPSPPEENEEPVPLPVPKKPVSPPPCPGPV